SAIAARLSDASSIPCVRISALPSCHPRAYPFACRRGTMRRPTTLEPPSLAGLACGCFQLAKAIAVTGDSSVAPLGLAGAMRGDVAEEGEDDEDPFPASDSSSACVPEDDVDERGQGQEDEPEDRPDDRAKRAVDPRREDPGQHQRKPRREEGDQYGEAAQRRVLPFRPAGRIA